MRFKVNDESSKNNPWKKYLIVLPVAAVSLVVLYVILGLTINPEIFPKNNDQQLMPEEGNWYCEELQIYLSFEEEGEMYAVIDGMEVPCQIWHDRGSVYFSIVADEGKHEDLFPCGTKFFSGEYVELTENKYIVLNRDTNKEIIFKRVTAQCVPSQGVWYCEQIGLELNSEVESTVLMTDENGVQYFVSSDPQRRKIKVCTIITETPVVENGKKKIVYETGDVVYQFVYVSLENDKYTVEDEAGNEFVFVKVNNTRDGSVS